MKAPLIATLCTLLAASPALAAKLDAEAVNSAALPSKGKENAAALVKTQVLLDRLGFSPGEIDGKPGENLKKALAGLARSKGYADGKSMSAEDWQALTAADNAPAIIAYKISPDDIKGPFVQKIPSRLEDMKDLPSLGYTSAKEALAEKFHVSVALLAELNPGKALDRAGEEIMVPNVREKREAVQVARIVVDKSRQTVEAFQSDGKLVAFFPATVGSSEKPTPGGTLKVTSSDPNPNYRYNPDYKFKGVKAKQPFTIKPGPNSPVGSYWIGLSAEGYGIHGTADPSKVSKAESHGCVRLTNWDANWLGTRVKKGTPVEFRD